MIENCFDRQTGTGHYIIHPTRSMSWYANKVFLLCVALNGLIIAIGFAFIGGWLIAPFMGFEIGLLAICLYCFAAKAKEQEVIFIKDDQIIVERGYAQPLARQTLSRRNSRVLYQPNEEAWELPRLWLVSGTSRIEIGQFLNKVERTQLAKNLKMDITLKY